MFNVEHIILGLLQYLELHVSSLGSKFPGFEVFSAKNGIHMLQDCTAEPQGNTYAKNLVGVWFNEVVEW